MRVAIPLGAVLLVGIAAGIHPAFVGPALPDRRLPAGRETPLLLPLPEASLRVVEAVPVQPEAPQKGRLPEAVAAPRKAAEPTWRKMATVLNLDLALSEIQKTGVEEVLRDRVQEIQKCQDAIRKSGVLDVRHYEWQVGRMKESWYRRIDALLDAEQHERFVGLVEKGFFNDGLGITEEPGMTVLD